jgi:hypothetical protein
MATHHNVSILSASLIAAAIKEGEGGDTETVKEKTMEYYYYFMDQLYQSELESAAESENPVAP